MHRGQQVFLVGKKQRVSQEGTASQELMDSQTHKYMTFTIINLIENLASIRLDSKNFQEPNFFHWIRSTTVMEAHFPRKALAMQVGFFALGSTKLP